MMAYAESTQARPAEILQAMWAGVSPEDDRLPLGGQDRVLAERILFENLRECARRYDPTRTLGESEETARAALRGVQLDGEPSRPSHQRRHHGEHVGKHSDALRSLSHSFSQHVVATWQAHRWANAKALPLLVEGFPNRVGLLRGFGNAIDPRPAAAFIQAAEEAVTEHLQEAR